MYVKDKYMKVIHTLFRLFKPLASQTISVRSDRHDRPSNILPTVYTYVHTYKNREHNWRLHSLAS